MNSGEVWYIGVSSALSRNPSPNPGPGVVAYQEIISLPQLVLLNYDVAGLLIQSHSLHCRLDRGSVAPNVPGRLCVVVPFCTAGHTQETPHCRINC